MKEKNTGNIIIRSMQLYFIS